MKTVSKYMFLFVLCELGNFIYAQNLDIRIVNIRNKNGQLCLAVFADEAHFKEEKTCWAMKCNKKDVINGEFHIQIPFQPGEWAFSVLDDENGNGKMEYNFMGIPREGFGFSDYFLKGLHRPLFKDFSFRLAKNETKTITVKLKYL
jgi:uncharacterized protein (DUF2141 family)